MNKYSWLSLAITLSLLSPAQLSLLAQTTTSNSQAKPTTTQQPIPNTTVTIPKATAIVVTFPNNTQFDAGGQKSFPIVLRLAEPILDNNGNVLAPVNSRVNALLVPVDKSTQIVLQSLIIKGKIVPIKAYSQKIPGIKIRVKTRMEQAKNYALSSGRFGTVALAFNNNSNSSDMVKFTLISQAAGAIVGFLSPRSILVTEFAQNSEYILMLEETVAL
ncbi:MAG TPA: hypothetical protein DDZ80_04375 [Cyanobacteria bacterium UBA8803]|nr:hypothetical protein [Cyanobacteria bacterium UBA9273]HBL57794.1 hypothetical protein [Cyanobacteria bacterium UBA8803]